MLTIYCVIPEPTQHFYSPNTALTYVSLNRQWASPPPLESISITSAELKGKNNLIFCWSNFRKRPLWWPKRPLNQFCHPFFSKFITIFIVNLNFFLKWLFLLMCFRLDVSSNVLFNEFGHRFERFFFVSYTPFYSLSRRIFN